MLSSIFNKPSSKRTLVSHRIGDTNVFNFGEKDLDNLVFVSNNTEITYSELTMTGVCGFNMVSNMLRAKYPSVIQEVYIVEGAKTLTPNEQLRLDPKNRFYLSNLLTDLEQEYRTYLSEKYIAYMTYATNKELSVLQELLRLKNTVSQKNSAEDKFLTHSIIRNLKSYMAMPFVKKQSNVV